MDYGLAGRTLRPTGGKKDQIVVRTWICRKANQSNSSSGPNLDITASGLSFPPFPPTPWGCVLAKCLILPLFYFITFYCICFLKYLFPLLDCELYDGKDCNYIVYCFYPFPFAHASQNKYLLNSEWREKQREV